MPKPYEFKNKEELHQSLRAKNTLKTAEIFFSQRSQDIASVVKKGLTGNTFRAFRNLPVQPSVTFRNWATRYVTDTQQTLISITDCNSYMHYVHCATNSLCAEWRRVTGSEMGYGRGAKLFNLVLKKFACLSCLSDEQRSVLINLQHVPLDSYTIIGLRAIAPQLAIPKGATMKFIETPRQYAEFQDFIREIATKAAVPPIYYDVLAWDMGHSSGNQRNEGLAHVTLPSSRPGSA